MKPLIIQEEVITANVNQDVLNDIAIKLLKENHKIIKCEITRDLYEEEFEVSLLVGDGYEVTIKQTKIEGMI